MPGIAYERSTEPVLASFVIISRLFLRRCRQMVSVWYGVSLAMPRVGTVVSTPLISTCGARPTERFMSEMSSENDRMC